METLQDTEPGTRILEIEQLAEILLKNNRERNARLGIDDKRFRVSQLGARNVERAVSLELLTFDNEIIESPHGC